MILQKIHIDGYKNIVSTGLTFGNNFNYIVGQNGMGKTNLLDAIYFVAMGKSYSLSQDKLLINHESDYLRIESGIVENEEQVDYTSSLGIRRSKVIERNGVPYTLLADHIGEIPIVFISPTDPYTLFSASQERRKFIDRTISQSDQSYLKKLVRYNKLLKQRNALLKQGKRTNVHDLLDSYDTQMSPLAMDIYQMRLETIEFLSPLVSSHYKDIASNHETVSLMYESQLHKNNYLAMCHENRQKDLILNRSNTGIHRDDLKVKIDNYDIKKFASQGQMKSFVLALKLAQYQFLYKLLGKKPILLVDDIFAKLDKSRVQSLIKLLNSEQYGQIFITDTSLERMIAVMKNLNTPYRCYHVHKGKIIEKNE